MSVIKRFLFLLIFPSYTQYTIYTPRETNDDWISYWCMYIESITLIFLTILPIQKVFLIIISICHVKYYATIIPLVYAPDHHINLICLLINKTI